LRANCRSAPRARCRVGTAVAGALLLLVTAVPAAVATKVSGGAGLPAKAKGHDTPASAPLPPPGLPAQLSSNGRTATPPAEAPLQVKNAIYAANRINGKPYRYGGGHRRFKDRAYDCSGAVSYVLHAGGFLSRPLDSGRLIDWGVEGAGAWITVYASHAHAYVIVAGLRLDTSGSPSGPRWRRSARASRGFVVRHPAGF
jgi:hypothetical protein